MENRNEISKKRFKELIQQALTLLNMPSQEFKDTYNELIQQISKGIPKNAIEIRLNKEEVTISCIINEQKQCADIYLFFDKTEDEDAFIDHLIDYFDYSFKKRVWLLSDCIIKIEEIKDILAFHFCK